jgi:hypothetical protein
MRAASSFTTQGLKYQDLGITLASAKQRQDATKSTAKIDVFSHDRSLRFTKVRTEHWKTNKWRKRYSSFLAIIQVGLSKDVVKALLPHSTPGVRMRTRLCDAKTTAIARHRAWRCRSCSNAYSPGDVFKICLVKALLLDRDHRMSTAITSRRIPSHYSTSISSCQSSLTYTA